MESKPIPNISITHPATEDKSFWGLSRIVMSYYNAKGAAAEASSFVDAEGVRSVVECCLSDRVGAETPYFRSSYHTARLKNVLLNLSRSQWGQRRLTNMCERVVSPDCLVCLGSPNWRANHTAIGVGYTRKMGRFFVRAEDEYIEGDAAEGANHQCTEPEECPIEAKPSLGLTKPGVDGSSHVPLSTAEKRRMGGSTKEKQLLERLLKIKTANVERSAECVKALFTLLEIYGYRKYKLDTKANEAFTRTCEHWANCSIELGEGGWMKYAKYKFAAFFHAHTSQLEAPPKSPFLANTEIKDSPRQLACGTAGRFCLRLIRDKKTRDSFLASVLQVKKGCPRPSAEMVNQQAWKTFETLTDIKKVRPELTAAQRFPFGNGEFAFDRLTIENELRRTVREVFSSGYDRKGNAKYAKYTDRKRYSPVFPTTSANFGSSRAQGGGVSALANFASEHGFGYKDSKIRAWRRLPHPDFMNGRYSLYADEDERKPTPGVVRINDFEEHYERFYRVAFDEALHERPDVKPVGLAESLKVRVITKGPPLMSFVLKPLQSFLWSVVKKHPTFALIGKPVDEQYLKERLCRFGPLKLDEAFLSGDYSAATDNLAPWVSECIADEIAKRCGLTDDERTLFLRSLTGHTMHDPSCDCIYKSYGDTEICGCLDGPALQTWGQLMGSVTSFPILCLANAALCRFAYECCSGRLSELSSTPLAVNGDDVAMRIKLTGFKLWEGITRFGGLENSIGKTFFSREFAQINSVNFRYTEYDSAPTIHHPSRVHGRFTATPFVNLGLLFGLKRSGEAVGMDSIADDKDTIGARCGELMKYCPFELRLNVHGMFIEHHRHILSNAGVPWYMPESWGGVGLPLQYEYLPGYLTVGGDDISPSQRRELIATNFFKNCGPSEFDRRVAHRILELPQKYPVGKSPAVADWTTHNATMHKMHHQMDNHAIPKQWGPDKFQERRYSKFYRAMVCETFFQFVAFKERYQTYVSNKSDKLFAVRPNVELNSQYRMDQHFKGADFVRILRDVKGGSFETFTSAFDTECNIFLCQNVLPSYFREERTRAQRELEKSFKDLVRIEDQEGPESIEYEHATQRVVVLAELVTSADVLIKMKRFATRQQAALARNRRSWKRAEHSGRLPAPLSMRRILDHSTTTEFYDLTVGSVWPDIVAAPPVQSENWGPQPAEIAW